jgi:hypothetical protein
MVVLDRSTRQTDASLTLQQRSLNRMLRSIGIEGDARGFLFHEQLKCGLQDAGHAALV